MEINFTIIIELLGTLAFAISGIRMASGKQIDWFGAYIIGLVTATGGGTFRDLLLDVTPFWMLNSSYFLITALALAVTILFKDKVTKWSKTLFLFDTIGLGLFTIVGLTKSQDAGLPVWVCIFMGTATGAVGGILRDVLLNEVPLILRKDVYALACVAGGLVYFIFYYLDFPSDLSELIGALTVILVRLIAIQYHIQLPVLPESSGNSKNHPKNK